MYILVQGKNLASTWTLYFFSFLQFSGAIERSAHLPETGRWTVGVRADEGIGESEN